MSKEKKQKQKQKQKQNNTVIDYIRNRPSFQIILISLFGLTIAVVFFMIGYFQPRKASPHTHFITDTSKYNRDSEKLSKIQKELSAAQTSLSTAQSDERSVRDNTKQMVSDISEKEQTQTSLSVAIENLKDKKENLEEMIKTEQIVASTQGSPTGQTAQAYGIYSSYEKLVHAYAEKYKFLTLSDEKLTDQSGPYYIRAEYEYEQTSNQDEVTKALLDSGNLNFTQNRKAQEQMACLLYDIVNAIKTGNY